MNGMKKQIEFENAKKQLQYALDELQNENIERDLLHDYISDALRIVKNLTIPDVVQQSEQFKAIVFKMANMLALAGKGNEAVQMHRIHNSL